MVDAVAGKLTRASVGQNEVTLDAGVDDLDDDLLVGETDNQAVLGGVAAKLIRVLFPRIFDISHVLLVLRLGDQALAGIVCKSCIFVSDFSS